MNILGITPERCSGSALFVKDEIIFASSEERFSKIKSDESYPFQSINESLKVGNLSPNNLDKILIAGNKLTLIPMILGTYSRFSISDNLKAMNQYWYPKLIENKSINIFDIFADKIDLSKYPFLDYQFKDKLLKLEHPITEANSKFVSNFYKKAISDHLGISQDIIEQIDHHECHASYGFFGSPFRDSKTLIVTADAWGDDLSGTVSIFNESENKIERVKKYSHKDFQLGRIYRYVTLFLRMLPSDHEYKVMGLAPYYDGLKSSEVEKIFHNMQTLNGIDFSFNKNIQDIFHYISENLTNYRFDQIASGIQNFTENILENWFTNLLEYFNCDKIVFSGGLSMNVKANMKISQIQNLKNIFICGGGGDESLSIGACYQHATKYGIKPKPLKNLYLGTESNYDVSQIHDNKLKIYEYKNVEQIFEKILDGKIIATCIGRSEMGPRALGNRSILADPRNRFNVEKINRSIKNRDFWMPFAPIILDEFQDDIIDNPKRIESPYMTIAFDTKSGKEKIPAAVHQYDGTARPMILKKSMNPIVWDLIYLFYKRTGIPVLLNTSFNLHGEPLVNDVKDAIRVFNNSDLDILWLDNHIIEK